MVTAGLASVGRACRVLQLQRSLWYYQKCKDDSAIVVKLSQLAEEYPTLGFDMYYAIIRSEAIKWARSRLVRVYRQMKLCRRRKHKRRLPHRTKEPLQKQVLPNQRYSMDL